MEASLDIADPTRMDGLRDCLKERSPPDSSREGAVSVSAGRVGSWHLPVGQTLSSLCEVLNRRGIHYVALPTAVARDAERSALLVSDEHLPRIRDLITRIPLGRQVAVYSVTDLPGFTFQQHWRHLSDGTNMAILPSSLAEALLARAAVDECGIRTPALQDMFLWTIYRALYLCGDSQFEWTTSVKGAPILIGPLTRIIMDFSRRTGARLSEPFTLEALHQHVSDRGWEPPFDVLRRLSPRNSWAACKVRERESIWPPEQPGITAFFIRRAVSASGIDAEIVRIIESGGFEVLRTIDLDEDQMEAAATGWRGGNWGPGAFPVSGGPPVRLLIAFDVLPARLAAEERQKYPHLDNAHVLEAKLRCREFILERMPANRRFNPVHSTDDSGDAWRVIRMFAADEEPALREIIESRKAAMSTDFEVIKVLTRKAPRAKVELIRYRGELAVKKTFRHNCLRYLEREASFMEAVSSHRSEILPVLERGPNYFIMPFVDGRPMRRGLFGRSFPRLMTLSQIRIIADLLRYLFSRGYDPIDLAPHNLLVDRSGRLTAIDFEFVHRTEGPIQPELSACLSGIPENFEGEWPPKALWCPRRAKCIDPWRLRWFGCTGLTLRSFLYDPPWLQRIKRIANYPYFLSRKAMQRGSELLRERAKRTLRRRLPVITRAAVYALRSNAR